jgi:hypothetical protein
MAWPFMDRETQRALAEAGYSPLDEYVQEHGQPMPHAVPIRHDIFKFYEAIAKRESTTAAVVINDTLRKHVEGVA